MSLQTIKALHEVNLSIQEKINEYVRCVYLFDLPELAKISRVHAIRRLRIFAEDSKLQISLTNARKFVDLLCVRDEEDCRKMIELLLSKPSAFIVDGEYIFSSSRKDLHDSDISPFCPRQS